MTERRSQFRDSEVVEGEFGRLTLVNGDRLRGEWRAAVLSGYSSGPTWVFVDGKNGDVVPFSAVVVAEP
jgi:hypothetical protein